MNSQQLQHLLKKHCISKYDFAGVYSLDNLPRKALKRAYIINFDKSNESGSHWVSIVFSIGNKKPAEYFDSFGYPPKHKEIIKFLKNNSYYWIYNSKQIQNENTFVCGQYCVIFILCKLKNIKMKTFQSYFGRNFIRNDKIVYYKIQSLLKHLLPFTYI